MTVVPAQKAETERQLETAVVELAHYCGWRSYHSWMSIHSAQGFPDLTLGRRGRLIFAELKAEKGKLSAHQEAWLAELRLVQSASGGIVAVYCWRPSDWPEIEEALR
jgi:hypothetical protein